jgi:hypothetical protein
VDGRDRLREAEIDEAISASTKPGISPTSQICFSVCEKKLQTKSLHEITITFLAKKTQKQRKRRNAASGRKAKIKQQKKSQFPRRKKCDFLLLNIRKMFTFARNFLPHTRRQNAFALSRLPPLTHSPIEIARHDQTTTTPTHRFSVRL